ncbi:hypothetical protein [Paenibacillus xylanilyticus]|uniref:Uncharacterized protein n=1 Tax=Paenibacillus xylanilyticus TaxID=248903 RepID=A0A7Y6BW31_9BACL|nr:hypothetical protein [Paenibacillus xylanilyticus]NUU76065.1 hypothetical protein [Paenibacillus xylanilyticus]
MKRNHRPLTVWLLACLTVISVALAVPWIWWQSQAPVLLNIMIIDKTSPKAPYPGYKGLVWLLNQQKIVQRTGERYFYDENNDEDSTVNGVSPVTGTPQDEIAETDLIYLTSSRINPGPDVSPKQSKNEGDEGLTIYDAHKIREAADRGVTVVVEYNTQSLWTSNNVREQLYPILGLKSSGWRGKYVSSLQSRIEVPEQVRIDYEHIAGQEWPYYGQGILLVHEDGRVIVLRGGKDVRAGELRLSFTEIGRQWSGIHQEIRYSSWFDVVVPDQPDAVLARYKVDLTAEGRQKLVNAGIPSDFPAIVRNDMNYRAYYMTGSFGELEHYSFWRRIKGWDVIKGWLTSNQKGIPDMFYWKVYVPVMKQILEEVQAEELVWR